MGANTEGFVSANEFAALTGKSRQWICTLIKSGRLKAEKVGHQWMVDPLARLPENGNSAKRQNRLQRRAELLLARRAGLSIEEIGSVPLPANDAPVMGADAALWIEQQLDKGWIFDEHGRSHVPGIRPWRAAPRGWTSEHWAIVQTKMGGLTLSVGTLYAYRTAT